MPTGFGGERVAGDQQPSVKRGGSCHVRVPSDREEVETSKGRQPSRNAGSEEEGKWGSGVCGDFLFFTWERLEKYVNALANNPIKR